MLLMPLLLPIFATNMLYMVHLPRLSCCPLLEDRLLRKDSILLAQRLAPVPPYFARENCPTYIFNYM